jgi:ribosomal protein S18 acetylase RimI-like enzyme
MDWTIRAATPADTDALVAFAATTFTDTFGPLYPPEDLSFFLREKQAPATCAAIGSADHLALIAEAGGAFAGYLIGGPMDLPFDTQGRPSVCLDRLYLTHAAKGSGLADALMQRFFTWGGGKDLYLSVYEPNKRAQAFYRRHGFEIVAAYTFWVGKTADDERIMRRRAD